MTAAFLFSDLSAQQYVIADVNIDANATSTGSSVTQTDKFQGVKTVSRETIESMPSANGDFTSLLKTNANVRVAEKSRSSNAGGEVDPANISINDARFWQNNFNVDGININNDIDPARAGKYGSDDGLDMWGIYASSAQGVALDSDFLESVSVYDSDVSARYGGFTGGVVDAKTRNPREGFHGKVSLTHTQGAWSKFHVDDKEKFYSSSDADYQPKFSKWITRLNLEGFITDELGLMFGYSHTRSKIPLQAYDKRSDINLNYGDLESERVQRRDIKNYFLKAVWFATDRLTITPTITYAPQTNKFFKDDVKDSFMDMRSGGLNLGLKADYEADWGSIFQTLAYSDLQSSRDAANEYYRQWNSSNLKPWGLEKSIEGGIGDVEQRQKTYAYNLDFEFNEFDALGVSHKIKTGLELKNQNARYKVKNGFYMALRSSSLNGVSCEAGDELCSQDDSFGGNGQYLSAKSIAKSGKTKAQMSSYAVYLEDEIRAGNLTLRPGVRFNADNYMDKKTIAPRFTGSYDFAGDESSVLSFGANRYYGRNVFAFKLQEGREELLSMWMRNSPSAAAWRELPEFYSNTSKFSKLNVPYDDELSLGFKQILGDYELGVKYINRKGRDQVIRKIDDDGKYTYENGGRSDSDIFTASVRSLEQIRVLGSLNSFELSYDYIKTRKNSTDYETDLDPTSSVNNEIIDLDGRVIKSSPKPTDDYQRPWTARLNLITKIPAYNLNLNNFFTVKGGQKRIFYTGRRDYRGSSIGVYRTTELGRSYTWDMRIGYEKKLPMDMAAFINLDIFNVLNKKNKAASENSSTTRLAYEAGRQFWLEGGIKW